MCAHFAPQATFCIGYATPLFLAYAIEYRAKLAFARRNGLLREHRPPALHRIAWRGLSIVPPVRDTALAAGAELLALTIQDTASTALLYVNLFALVNMSVVAAISRAEKGLAAGN